LGLLPTTGTRSPSSGPRSLTGSFRRIPPPGPGCRRLNRDGSSRWRAEVVQAIIEAVPDRYRALVVLAAGTGLRQGECFGLTLDRLDFLRRQLTVDRQLVLLPGSGPVLGAPKTQASYRVVPLPAVVLDALAAHLARYPVGPDGFLFTNHAGDPIRRTRFSDVWRPAVKSSELRRELAFTL
jgi:integrase